MSIDADGLLRHIHACDNARLPGGRVRLRLGAAEIGWVRPEHAPAAVLTDAASFAAYAGRLRACGGFRARDEAFDVRDEASGSVVAQVDRGAIPLLGIAADGVHVNGLVRRGGEVLVWVGRRADDKRLDPGKLDHLVAGGIAAGYDAAATLIKEAGEEASVPASIARTARAVGTLGYAMERAEGLRRDTLYCYDLELPEAFEPVPADGEVAGFELWPIRRVAQTVAAGDGFKFNVNLVLIDLFLRRNVVDAASPGGRAVAQAMERLRHKRHYARG